MQSNDSDGIDNDPSMTYHTHLAGQGQGQGQGHGHLISSAKYVGRQTQELGATGVNRWGSFLGPSEEHFLKRIPQTHNSRKSAKNSRGRETAPKSVIGAITDGNYFIHLHISFPDVQIFKFPVT